MAKKQFKYILAETKPDDPAGRPYKGKSLQMLLSEGKWDIVTIQQYSMHSTIPLLTCPTPGSCMR